jgi:spermidine synthase
MGFTTIAVELAAIIAFQSFYGYVYGKLSLLLAAFMGGLFLGAWPRSSKYRDWEARPRSWKDRDWEARPRHPSRPSRMTGLLAPQAGFLLIVAAFRISLADRAPETLFYVLLLALGALGGRLFVISARSVPPGPERTGWTYGADLLGSFLGALLTAAILIPLAGILPLFDALFLMNAFCLLFIVISRPKGKTSSVPAP